jgi:tRNA-2-methylthio-N6-dimethylallyladenosine synthase
MGKKRIPTLFPYLLTEVCERFPELKKISFMSSNPWDFSDELIDIIAKYPQIDRALHLPLQAGSTEILKRMKRFYSKEDYLNLVQKIERKIPKVEFTTDIIVGFPGETDKDFQDSVDVAKKVGFKRAYVARYSVRKGTFAAENYKDDISQKIKRERFHILDKLINKEAR